MDFKENLIKEKIDVLTRKKLSPKKASFSVVEKINQENVNIIEIDIDCENSIGLVIIYEDGYIFFNYLNKKDEKMKNESWSKKVDSVEEVLNDISDFLTTNIN